MTPPILYLELESTLQVSMQLMDNLLNRVEDIVGEQSLELFGYRKRLISYFEAPNQHRWANTSTDCLCTNLKLFALLIVFDTEKVEFFGRLVANRLNKVWRRHPREVRRIVKCERAPGEGHPLICHRRTMTMHHWGYGKTRWCAGLVGHRPVKAGPIPVRA